MICPNCNYVHKPVPNVPREFVSACQFKTITSGYHVAGICPRCHFWWCIPGHRVENDMRSYER